MNRPWDASYAHGLRLAEAGCSLPYLDSLPGREHFYQRKLYVSKVGGYIESYAIDWGTSTGYVLALRVGTDYSRAIITRYELVPPWPDHEIDWGYDLEDVLPESKLQDFEGLLESRLPSILNERRLLRQGRPVEGLLCGVAWTPIPASSPRDRPAMAEIFLIDGSGAPARETIQLTICTAIRQKRRTRDSTASRELQPVTEASKTPRAQNLQRNRPSSTEGGLARQTEEFVGARIV
ncbi:MAG TPA: hypothetical protein VKR82_00835 [Candidatus Acidoferrales bacterium]|nr:hypothetical protein [Candidatus Acidoferrales bacterium]